MIEMYVNRPLELVDHIDTEISVEVAIEFQGAEPDVGIEAGVIAEVVSATIGKLEVTADQLLLIVGQKAIRDLEERAAEDVFEQGQDDAGGLGDWLYDQRQEDALAK